MVLFLFSDTKYSRLTEGLIKSLRVSGNDHTIYFYMMNFTDKEASNFAEKFKDDSKIIYKRKTIDVSPKVKLHSRVANPLYQNNRVKYLIELMEEQDEDILQLCSNCLVFSKLNYFEDYFKTNDLIFLERTKTAPDGTTIRNIKEFTEYVVNNKLSIDKELKRTQNVLLGAHGFKNNNLSLSVLKQWDENIKLTKGWDIKTRGSDMMMFVKAYIQISSKLKNWIPAHTEWNIPREQTTICDTSHYDGNPIWFAKGAMQAESKNPKYHKKLKDILK
jgi:hypothetical protein|tara:strand:- start:9119 stop:9943 length:825 start_codon:yes stop_codon:yes gene_type:complete